MKIIKRKTGERVDFDKEKIVIAISKANKEMTNSNEKLTKTRIDEIANEIETYASNRKRALNVEEIQNLVEQKLMESGKYELAKSYITYRYQHQIDREGSPLDAKIFAIVNGSNQEAKEENANKNPDIIPVQRDYISGEVSRDMTKRLLLSKDITKATDEGLIWFHDSDYFISHSTNCCLVNLEDMLQNGTNISKTTIDKPHAFTTACNIATQIIAQVASNQYGGNTISVAHLAPFVNESRQKFIKEKHEEENNILNSLSGNSKKEYEKLLNSVEYKTSFDQIIKGKVEKEIEKGVQMLQYQIVTLMTTNGQTPFVSLALYLNEAKNEQEKEDLVLVIKEILEQRIKGLKNENGQWVTPAFPKLLYFLEEDNVRKGSKYYWLTELAAKCTAKRMVPDYISEKIMKEYKDGDVYPCMGAVSPESTVKWKFIDGESKTTTIENMWNTLVNKYKVEIKDQFDIHGNPNKDIVLDNVLIYDNKEKKYVHCWMMNRNIDNEWVKIEFIKDKKENDDKSEIVTLIVTYDHPLTFFNTKTNEDETLQAHQFYISPIEELKNYKFYYKDDETLHISSVNLIGKGYSEYSYDVTTDSEHFEVSGIYSHNCRSFLSVDSTKNGYNNISKAKNWKEGEHKYYGRFNKGVVTINLVDVALSSEKNFDDFWKIFDERLELCHKALLIRYERLKGTKSDVAPIMWQHGALARLEKGEVIDKLLEGGYSTLSLGYGGLYECVKYMTGCSHTEEKGREFGIKVMQYLNDACTKWNKEKNLGFSLYGTPMESTTYKFAKSLQKRFGIIPGITDKNYITNSYHVSPEEKIDAFTKLKKEAEFQKLSPGGAISYVEIPNMNDNIEGVLSIIEYIYENIMYAELNTRDDVCQLCDYHGQMEEKKDKDGIYYWECPKCGNKDQTKMNVARRVCGYIESNEVNQGKMDEYFKRVYHLQPTNKSIALSQKEKEEKNK